MASRGMRLKLKRWQREAIVAGILCPEGNGLDTFRFYEALMLGTIPIVRRNSLAAPLYERHFKAVVVVDEWSDVEEARLRGWRDSLAPKLAASASALRVRYWAELAERVLRTHSLLPRTKAPPKGQRDLR